MTFRRIIFPEFFFFVLRYIRSDVLRYINEHRSRPSALCNTECLPDRIGKLCNILDDKIMFCNGHRDPCDIDLLETVFSEKRYSHITGDRHDRDGIHVCRCNPGNKIRCAGSACRKTYAYFSGSPGTSVRSMGCALLM